MGGMNLLLCFARFPTHRWGLVHAIQLYIDLVALRAYVLPSRDWPCLGDSRQLILGGGKL